MKELSRFSDRISDHIERFFVITGGPGSGKSTLIDALERAGYARSVEAGRAIIQAQSRSMAPCCRGAIRPCSPS